MDFSSQDSTQSPRQSILVPDELVPVLEDLCAIYDNGQRDRIQKALASLIDGLKAIPKAPPFVATSSTESEFGDLNAEDFLKSWQDLLSLEVYVDTDIYSPDDFNPMAEAVAAADPLVTIEHEVAKDAYVQSWAEIAQALSSTPDNAFSRTWRTQELADHLECSVAELGDGSLEKPYKFKNFTVTCIGEKNGERLWKLLPD